MKFGRKFKKVFIASLVSSMMSLALLGTPVFASKSIKTNMSYLYFGNSQSFIAQVDETQNSLDAVFPDFFDLKQDGTLGLTSKYSKEFVKKMHAEGVKVIPFLSNHWDLKTGRTALGNMEALSDRIIQIIQDYDFDGVNLDIEGLNELDRDNYTAFVKLLHDKMPEGKALSVAVAANPNNYKRGWHGSYDYEKVGQYSDYIVLMSYDEGYQGGPESPVASIPFVEKSVEKALEMIPKEKLILGVPFYGRYWKVGDSYGGYGISLEAVEALVKDYDGQVIYDEETNSVKATVTIGPQDKTAYVFGRALNSGTYTIWYENEASLKSKLRVVSKYDLKGTASWSLGQETSDVWSYYKLWLNGTYFNDIERHWAEAHILSVVEKGIMVGTSAVEFQPNKSLSRAEAATMIVRALQLESKDTKVTFKDMPPNHWAKLYVTIAAEHGIFKGDEIGNFSPDQSITREEIAVVIERLLEKRPELRQVQTHQRTFTDVESNRWSYPSIMAISEMGIISGYEDQTFRPKKNISRAEMATIFDRLL